MRTIHVGEANRRELTRVAAVASGWALDGPTLAALRDGVRSVESLRAIGAELRGALADNCFAVVNNVPSDNAAELAALLSLVSIPATIGNGDTLFFEIRPKQSAAEDISGSTAEFPFHTDSTFLMVPHDVLGLACRHNISAGGESLVLRAADVADRVREVGGYGALAALGDPVYPFYLRDPLFGHGTQLVPILAQHGEDWRIRYRGDVAATLVERFPLDDTHRRALAVFEGVLADPGPVVPRIRLQTDDLILIDNRRALHARTALGSGERLLLRTKGYLLESAVSHIV
jgi:alpha-ketoglutarate-dependent taurine dioxygenase